MRFVVSYLVSCQASNNDQSGVSFAGSLRCKKTYVAMAMLVFCALTSHKIYDRLTRHLRLDTTLVSLSFWRKSQKYGAPLLGNHRIVDIYKHHLGLVDRTKYSMKNDHSEI